MNNEIMVQKINKEEFGNADQFYRSVGYLQPILPTDLVIAAYSDLEIVGVVRLAFESGHTVLRGMMIAPKCQRQGLGTRMLKELDRHMENEECFCLPHDWLESFYGQIGFRKVEDTQAPPHLLKRLIANREHYPQLIVMRRRKDR